MPKQLKSRKRFSEPTDPRFRDTFFAVEATDAEMLFLWCRHAKDSDWENPHLKTRYTWDQQSSGCLQTIGTLGGHPICLTCTWTVIEGHRVLFWEASSQIVDYPLCEEWIAKFVKTNNRPAGTCNAMNFGACLTAIVNDKPNNRTAA